MPCDVDNNKAYAQWHQQLTKTMSGGDFGIHLEFKLRESDAGVPASPLGKRKFDEVTPDKVLSCEEWNKARHTDFM